MTKRLVEINDELLAQARELSDANTIKGTVEEALAKLVRIEMAKRHIRGLSRTQKPNAVDLLEKARRVEQPPNGLPD